MLITVLVMAIALSLEPFRIGMTVLMLNRPRPMLQLSAFLCGGFAMGMTVGAVVLFGLRRRLLESTHLSLPKIQIFSGSLILLFAVVLAVTARMRHTGGSNAGRQGPGVLARRTERLLHGRSLWVAGVAGLGIAMPSADYLAALAIILASGAAITTQFAVLLIFNVVAFALVEIPLFAYLLAPQSTRASMAALNEWIRSRRRIEVAILVAAVGCVLLTVGIADA